MGARRAKEWYVYARASTPGYVYARASTAVTCVYVYARASIAVTCSHVTLVPFRTRFLASHVAFCIHVLNSQALEGWGGW